MLPFLVFEAIVDARMSCLWLDRPDRFECRLLENLSMNLDILRFNSISSSEKLNFGGRSFQDDTMSQVGQVSSHLGEGTHLDIFL